LRPPVAVVGVQVEPTGIPAQLVVDPRWGRAGPVTAPPPGAERRRLGSCAWSWSRSSSTADQGLCVGARTTGNHRWPGPVRPPDLTDPAVGDRRRWSVERASVMADGKIGATPW